MTARGGHCELGWSGVVTSENHILMPVLMLVMVSPICGKCKKGVSEQGSRDYCKQLQQENKHGTQPSRMSVIQGNKGYTG